MFRVISRVRRAKTKRYKNERTGYAIYFSEEIVVVYCLKHFSELLRVSRKTKNFQHLHFFIHLTGTFWNVV